MRRDDSPNRVLADFLADYEPLTESWPVWGDGRIPLRQRTYLCPTLPPADFITSARAILFRENDVMVIRDHQDDPYVVPGGRREPGETVWQTLHREILEETGWTFTNAAMLGFVHFRHLGPKPPNYSYVYPDFLHAVYTAVADAHHPAAIEPDPYVTDATFRPITEVLTLNLDASQQILLTTAVKKYRSET